MKNPRRCKSTGDFFNFDIVGTKLLKNRVVTEMDRFHLAENNARR